VGVRPAHATKLTRLLDRKYVIILLFDFIFVLVT
jgi:hypothetical protein